MRELNELKAEIFSRSEKRIKERKRKRAAVLALAVPICITVAVCSATLLPKITSDGADGFLEEVTGNLQDNENGSLVCSYTEVTVYGTGDTIDDAAVTITDEVRVTQIFQAVFTGENEATSGSNTMPEDSLQDSNGDPTKHENDNLKGPALVITLTFATAEGDTTTYTLSGNEVTNIDEGVTTILSDEELSELKELLGLYN